MSLPTGPLSGFATAEGTARYAREHDAAPGHFRTWRGLALSTVGLGSYLGGVGPRENEAYEEAAATALRLGCNVLDTAANYRDQQSERDLGRALHRHRRRDEVLVVTKAGFLHGDSSRPGGAADFVRSEYVDTGILSPADVAGGMHSLAPAFLRHEAARSRANLDVEGLDVLLVHNPEAQLSAGVDRATFAARMVAAFGELERLCDEGQIGCYGVATWDGLRVPPGHASHLALVDLIHWAGQARLAVGGRASEHHFRALELPINLGMVEAATEANQPWRSGHVTLLSAAAEQQLLVLASASLLQRRLLGQVPNQVHRAFGTTDDAVAGVEFVRSLPGVTTALVGMGRPEHARANVTALAKRSPDLGAAQGLLVPA